MHKRFSCVGIRGSIYIGANHTIYSVALSQTYARPYQVHAHAHTRTRKHVCVHVYALLVVLRRLCLYLWLAALEYGTARSTSPGDSQLRKY